MKLVGVKYKKIIAFCVFLVGFNIANIFYFQNQYNPNNAHHQRELIKSSCECHDTLLLRHFTQENLVTFNKLSTKDNVSTIETNLYNLTREEYGSSRFMCDSHNVMRRGPNQKILSYSINELDFEKSLVLLEKVASLARNLYPFWSIRVYYDSQVDNKSNFNNFKCKYECKYNNLDVCDVNKLKDSKRILIKDWNLWKFLPCGDSFVEVFSSRSLSNWKTILQEFNVILKWFNARKYDSHLFINNNNNENNVTLFSKDYWSFHNSMNRNLSNRVYGALLSNFSSIGDEFFANNILPLVENVSKFNVLKLMNNTSRKNLSIFNEKVIAFYYKKRPSIGEFSKDQKTFRVNTSQ
jgi:hypothetical protein